MAPVVLDVEADAGHGQSQQGCRRKYLPPRVGQEDQREEGERMMDEWLNLEPPLSYFPEKFGP